MLRKLICALMLLLVIPTSAQERAPAQSAEAVAAWRADLDTLAREMERIHPNLYWRLSRDEFAAAFAALAAELPYLTDEQIKVGIIRLGALVDGHSFVDPFQPAIGFHLVPLQLYLFADGLYVIDADAAYAHLIGGRVVNIGDLSAAAALERIAPVVNYENEWSRQFGLPFFAIIPEVLRAYGIEPRYTVEFPDGTHGTITPTEQSASAYRAWHNTHWLIALRPRSAPLSMQRVDENFWFTYLPDTETLYIQYNAAQARTQSGSSLVQFADDLAAEYIARAPQRLVLDLRYNLGGDDTTYHPLLNWLAAVPTRLNIIIGRNTFSAGVNFLVELEQRADDLVYVGEPTGSDPLIYASARVARLPNSRIEAMISARNDTVVSGDDRPWIEPDIYIESRAADFFAGIDPAMAAILAYEP